MLEPDRPLRSPSAAVTERPVVADGAFPDRAPAPDRLAVEEPLEIRAAGETVAVIMRTPGTDEALAVGFLFAEGLVESRADLGRVAHCGRPDDEGYGNVIDVLPGPGFAFDLDRVEGARRGGLTTAACGVCGRRSIDDLMDRMGPVGREELRLESALLRHSTDALRSSQPGFRATGSLHAAAILSVDGARLAVAEDVGRHNAVDKVVGRLVMADGLGDAALLVVSGRVSFEIVQKAATAKMVAITAVGAPTSLAVDLAEQSGITLCAFVRDGRLPVYTHAERVRDRPNRPHL